MGRPLSGLKMALVNWNDDGKPEFLPDETAGIGEMAVRLEGLAPWKSLGGEAGAPPEDVDGWHYTMTSRGATTREITGSSAVPTR
jgi:hypothetical protein